MLKLYWICHNFTERKKIEIEKIHVINPYEIDNIKDLKTRKAPISINNEVRELKCKVSMDNIASDTSRILDVEDFNGETITHIPCLQHVDIGDGPFNIGCIIGPSGSGKTTSIEDYLEDQCRLYGILKIEILITF